MKNLICRTVISLASLACIVAAIAIPACTATVPTVPTTQPVTTAPSTYTTIANVVTGAEVIANGLAVDVPSFAPDIALAEGVLNLALSVYHNLTTPQVGAALDEVAIADGEAKVHAALLKLETLNVQASAAKVAKMAPATGPAK